jgi:hypothetical protein
MLPAISDDKTLSCGSVCVCVCVLIKAKSKGLQDDPRCGVPQPLKMQTKSQISIKW